jgi:GTPase
MLRFSCVARKSIRSRRKWEERIASVLNEKKEADIDHAAKRFERIYKQKQFAPVDKTFPPLASSLGVSTQPPGAHVVKAAFLGPQNTGKSSLVNALCHAHLSAESKRSGSTDDVIRGIATVNDTQMVLLDTPGLVQVRAAKDRKRHAEAALKAWDSIFSADLVVLTLGAGLGLLEPEHKSIAKEVERRAMQRGLPLVLAITMMDKVQTPRQRDMYCSLRSEIEGCGLRFTATHETTTKDSKGLVELKDTLCTFAKPGEWVAYRHEVSPLQEKDRLLECVRQSFMDNLPHEIPHTIRSRLIGWTTKDNGGVEVVVEVFVARPAYLFTFYSKLEVISQVAQRLAERELGKRFFFVFQGFLTPGEVSANSK